MGEALEGIQSNVNVSQIKMDLFDPKTISKNNDQDGRDKLAAELREKRRERDVLHQDMFTTQTELDNRQSNLLVKLRTKLNIPDKQTQELEALKLEQGVKNENLPDLRKMVDAYYEKVAETPLTNQEKRDLLKPEVLEQLSTDEYIALWKRLNPHFLTHVTRQGLRDHTGGDSMVNHSRGSNSFNDGFVDVMKNEKSLFPPLARIGLKDRSETTIKIFLSGYPLQADNETEALKRFDTTLHQSKGEAPTYPDYTSTHLAAQIVSDRYYGGETDNEICFVYPSDVLASQYPFAFNGWEKDFTQPQSETKWNDVFVWTDPNKPGIPIDSGVVFLPKNTKVDQNTGSKYASEIIQAEDGANQRIPIEDTVLIGKFESWVNALSSESPIIKAVDDAWKRNDSKGFDMLLRDEMLKIGVPADSIGSLLYMSGFSQDLFIFKVKDPTDKKYIEDFKSSNAKYKRAENTISAKEYWEKFFSENPSLKPKHVVYYDGDPTIAIYKFQQENGIGVADTSKTDGPLLGFDDHHVVDMASDPRANKGHDELVTMGKKIISEHYQYADVNV